MPLRLRRDVWRAWLAASLLVLVAAAAAFTAPLSARAQNAGAGLALTPRVRADYLYTHTADGQRRVVVMVLWRGAARWYAQSSRSKIGMPLRSASDSLAISVQATYGSTQTAFTYHPPSHTLRLFDQEFLVADSNIVLVDGVDAPNGNPRVVGRARIELLPNGPDANHRQAILAHADTVPVLREFLELVER